MRKLIRFLLIVNCQLLIVNCSFAQWTNGGTLLSSPGKNNVHTIITPTLDSGAYITWISTLTDKNFGDIYLTGIDASGNFLPGWISGPKKISQDGAFMAPVVIASEDGGVIAAWSGVLTGDSLFHNYVQKYSKDGIPLWNNISPVMIPANGVDQSRYPIIISDKHKGIYMTWARYDSANSSSSLDIYLTHIDSTGAVAKGWDPNRTVVTNIPDYREYYPRIVLSNDEKSVYVMYTQGQILEASVILKKFNTSDGSIANGWTSEGVVVTAGPEVFTSVMYGQWLFCDKKSNNVIAFWCERLYKDMGEMYMRPISPEGTLLLTQKRIDGMESPYGSDYLEVSQDEDGNFLVADNRYNDNLSTDVNISKVTPGNQVIWQKLPLTHNHLSGFPKAVSDGHKGAFVFYRDYQGSMYTIGLDSLGNVHNKWVLPANKFGSIANWDGYNPQFDYDVVPGKKGQALVAWVKSDAGLINAYACNILYDGTPCSLIPSAIDDLSENEETLNVYPNPFTTEIYIRKDAINRVFTMHNVSTLNFKLFNLTGNIIIDQQISESPNHQINTSILSNGMYFYTISDNKLTIQTGKIIKQ